MFEEEPTNTEYVEQVFVRHVFRFVVLYAAIVQEHGET
jgi:hypothetical protein